MVFTLLQETTARILRMLRLAKRFQGVLPLHKTERKIKTAGYVSYPSRFFCVKIFYENLEKICFLILTWEKVDDIIQK